ncbi:unnamed protein product [Sphacelaria rigidula]
MQAWGRGVVTRTASSVALSARGLPSIRGRRRWCEDARQRRLLFLSCQHHQIHPHQQVGRFLLPLIVTSLTSVSTLPATAANSPGCIGTGFWLASDSKSEAGVESSGDGHKRLIWVSERSKSKRRLFPLLDDLVR